MNVYLAVGASTAAAGNYFAVLANSLATPFNVPTYDINATTAVATFAFAGQFVQGYTINTNPMGFAELAGLWTNYKVKSYRIRVTVYPQGSADSCEAVLFPIGIEEIPSSSASSVNIRTLATQPRAVSQICSFSVPSKYNTLTLSQEVHNLLGIRKSAWESYPPTPMNAAPTSGGGALPSLQGYVGFFMQQLNGSNNASAMSVRVELEQVVECSDLVQQLS